ncbi:MAG: hypothetical protein R2747_02555 [Pyrinomonadaceae bacterium]
MCCSVSPRVYVDFKATKVYGAEVKKPDGKVVHVLGYQNEARNNVGSWRSMFPFNLAGKLIPGGANAMILPFPAVPRTMTEANVLDTKKCPNVLEDISKTIYNPYMEMASQGLQSKGARSMSVPAIQVFRAAGIYTVVLAQDARLIPEALKQVPLSSRPKLNPELFESYARWYPDWTFALCCFNNSRLKRALPLLWWYEPMFPEEIFLPALDSHTGEVPSLNNDVDVDHVLAVSSYQMNRNVYSDTVFYKDKITPELRPYLAEQVIGERYKRPMKNGDFVFDLKEVRNGVFSPIRKPPFGKGERVKGLAYPDLAGEVPQFLPSIWVE